MKKVILPYVGMEQIKRFILDMPRETSTMDELANRFGLSTVRNILPTLILLKLAEYNRKEQKVSLSENGRKFRVALINEDYKKAREIIKNTVDEIELFVFVRGLLERKGSLDIKAIGEELAFKYNKVWNNPRTYATYGAACASILSFAGYGIYERGILRKGESVLKKEKKLPSPYLSVNKMIRIIENIGNGVVDIHTLSERLKTNKNRIGSELSVCVELGLIERVSPGKFKVTIKGKRLIDPLNTHNRNRIWREILLESRYNKIIDLLKNEEFDLERLADILQHHFGGDWKEDNTKISFAKRFLNWLKEANLLKETNGKYKLIDFEIPKEKISKKISVGIPLMDYYTLGKSVGIVMASSDSMMIEVAISKLIDVCSQDESLLDITELLKQHLEIFRDMKLSDGRIFIPDINLLEKRLGLVSDNEKL